MFLHSLETMYFGLNILAINSMHLVKFGISIGFRSIRIYPRNILTIRYQFYLANAKKWIKKIRFDNTFICFQTEWHDKKALVKEMCTKSLMKWIQIILEYFLHMHMGERGQMKFLSSKTATRHILTVKENSNLQRHKNDLVNKYAK